MAVLVYRMTSWLELDFPRCALLRFRTAQCTRPRWKSSTHSTIWRPKSATRSASCALAPCPTTSCCCGRFVAFLIITFGNVFSCYVSYMMCYIRLNKYQIQYKHVLLRQGFSSKVQTEAAAGLWSIAFKCRDEVARQPGCITGTQPLLVITLITDTRPLTVILFLEWYF